MTFGRRMVAAAVCVPLLVVAGCADDPKPKVASPSETPTSSSPTPTPASQPWEKKTNAGAVAFAKHWIDVFNEAQRTGDTSAMRELSAKSCGSCSGFAGMLENLYSGGGRIESDGWSVRSSVASDGLGTDRGRVAMRVERSAQTIHHGNGDPKENFAKSEVTLSARMSWRNAAWVMDDLVALE